MKEEMEPMKLGLKDYIRNGTFLSTRKTWEVRSHMLDVAGNFPGHRKYEPSNWMCHACRGVREDQEHLTQCEAYKNLRGDHDLENQEEVVEFFMKVMNRRKEKNWNYAMMRERCESSTVRAKL